MPNDAKLGLLAGVAGVVLAAALYFPGSPAGPPPPGPPAAAALPAVPVPSPVARATPQTPTAPPVAVVAGTRGELEARPTSRTTTPDEDE